VLSGRFVTTSHAPEHDVVTVWHGFDEGHETGAAHDGPQMPPLQTSFGPHEVPSAAA